MPEIVTRPTHALMDEINNAIATLTKTYTVEGAEELDSDDEDFFNIAVADELNTLQKAMINTLKTTPTEENLLAARSLFSIVNRVSEFEGIDCE